MARLRTSYLLWRRPPQIDRLLSFAAWSPNGQPLVRRTSPVRWSAIREKTSWIWVICTITPSGTRQMESFFQPFQANSSSPCRQPCSKAKLCGVICDGNVPSTSPQRTMNPVWTQNFLLEKTDWTPLKSRFISNFSTASNPRQEFSDQQPRFCKHPKNHGKGIIF